ncbi:urease accessory protein UreE [Helicobacter cynogastricus]|uniref:urease accessory protein UreE n=1 Tax=Helicobacter cynogastricus TaxID=329937 RepID=UPI000CF1055A|nr:urease accessory protein UreE [Helicobacter cynogastricus]
MIRTHAILGNIFDQPRAKVVDHVNLEWFDTQKRMGRWVSEGGLEIALKLDKPPLMGLRDGDILFEDESCVVSVNILPTEILCVYARNCAQVAKLCYEVGNRHASLYYGDQDLSFQTPFDKPLKVLFEKLGVSHEVLKGKLDSSRRISVSAPHANPLDSCAPLKFQESDQLLVIKR